MQIRTLLGHNNTRLVIPRFQRDYSWETKEVQEFLEDLINTLRIQPDNKITTGDYFFGTILLAGDLNESGSEIEVIDGQQRITTATILLSVIANIFRNIDEANLSQYAWEYILKSNDDGEKFRVLKNRTVGHYFEYTIQTIPPEEIEPLDEETERIANAIKVFTDLLSEGKLKKKLITIHNNNKVISSFPYVELLKSIRNQLLNSKVICISTKDRKSSNLIFEILNAKGKQLEPIDLIKNTIFKYLNEVEPTDDANNKWIKIKNNLIDRNVRIEMSTFFRHYWLSKYKKVKDDQLFSEFTKEIEPSRYKDFLDELVIASELYLKIVAPLPSDYENKQEFLYIPEYLNYLNYTFNIKQCRVALLALLSARNKPKNNLKNKYFKDILNYLHSFHFAYSALCSKRANTLESKYSRFAIQISNAKNTNDMINAINYFKSQLDDIFPDFNEFKKAFVQLEYSKGQNSGNMISKYVIYNLEKYYSSIDYPIQNGSIEHLVSESQGNKSTLNIGNLILIEKTLNEELGDADFTEKIEGYKKSKFSHINKFLEEYTEQNPYEISQIHARAEKLAEVYYFDILKRPRKK